MNTNYTGSHRSNHNQHVSSLPEENTTMLRKEEERRTPPLLTSEIPDADLSVDFSMIMGTPSEETEKLEKRKSNIAKLNEENEKLRRELKAMSERLEAAERKRAQLQAQEQKSGE